MIIQGVGAGSFGVVLLAGMVAIGSWLLGVLALLMLGVAAFSLYQAKTFRPTLIADSRGVSLAKSASDGGTLHLAWEEVARVFVHNVRGANFRLLCVLPRDVSRHLPVDAKLRRSAEKSIQITGAPFSANLVAASISDEQALRTVQALAGGRTVVG